MTIKTRYSYGDSIIVNGVYHDIVAIHVYESKNVHTERYYLGNSMWFTIEENLDEVWNG